LTVKKGRERKQFEHQKSRDERRGKTETDAQWFPYPGPRDE
jgi:hypothetical protein